MAQRVQIVLEDDIDGGEAVETIRFSLDGVDYEIDLSADNARKLRDDFAPWVGHARKVSRGSGARTQRKARVGAGAVRDWARANGYEVSDRGRVPADVRAAYDRAHA